MKEIEILVQLHTPVQETIKVLSAVATQEKIVDVVDSYFVDPLRPDLAPDDQCCLRASFRIREKGGKGSMAYKHDYFDEAGLWTYSDEHETEVGSISTALQIVRALGLRELVTVRNRKYVFNTASYEIVVEEVSGLGAFLEVELKSGDPSVTPAAAKAEIEKFIHNLGLETSRTFDGGKPELLLRKERGLAQT